MYTVEKPAKKSKTEVGWLKSSVGATFGKACGTETQYAIAAASVPFDETQFMADNKAKIEKLLGDDPDARWLKGVFVSPSTSETGHLLLNVYHIDACHLLLSFFYHVFFLWYN